MFQRFKTYLRLFGGVGTVHCGYPYWHPAHVWKETVYDEMFEDHVTVKRQCGGQ